MGNGSTHAYVWGHPAERGKWTASVNVKMGRCLTLHEVKRARNQVQKWRGWHHGSPQGLLPPVPVEGRISGFRRYG